MPDSKQVERTEAETMVEKRVEDELADLAKRLRNATDPKEIGRLGDPMGRMLFGG